MTTYRFRMRHERAPESLWRDVVVGADRTLAEFQAVLNRAVGLNQKHLWFFGAGRQYWDSRVQYMRPAEFEQSPVGALWSGEQHDAGETTFRQMARQLDLSEGDRICYLFDYGDEWRFYGELVAVEEAAPDDRPPEVVDGHGDPVEQYGYPG